MRMAPCRPPSATPAMPSSLSPAAKRLSISTKRHAERINVVVVDRGLPELQFVEYLLLDPRRRPPRHIQIRQDSSRVPPSLRCGPLLPPQQVFASHRPDLEPVRHRMLADIPPL